MIYLDHNATTPIDRRVADAMTPYLYDYFGNPSSTHGLGHSVRTAVDRAREQVARFLEASIEEIVFTSGGSESNNAAIKGIAFAKGGGHIITSAVDHPAVTKPVHWLTTMGFSMTAVGVDSNGMVDPDEVRTAIRRDTILISIMHANNEVGTIQPIAQISRIAREAGIPFHTDAAQSAGKVPTRVDDLGVELLSIAGHKMYAPAGIGVLFVRKGVTLEPLIHGAGHEGGRRAGTEPVAAIVGIGAAAELANTHIGDDRIRGLRDHFEQTLSERLGQRMKVNGHPTVRLPNTASLSFPGHLGFELLQRAGDIAASTGAACHSSGQRASHVLEAMGVDCAQAAGTIRFSFGRANDSAQTDRAIELILQALGLA